MDRIKNKIEISIISGFFLIFTFLIFGTFELYMSNQGEFWFPYKYMLPSIILISVLLIVVCVSILLILPNKLFKYGIALLNGFTLTLYMQGNFLPNDYGVLDGTAIEWDNYQWRLIYNSIIWCVLILAIVLIAIKNEKVFFSASRIAIGIILATQMITLITVRLMSPKIDNNSILSVDGQFEVSNKDNTFVFVLDCFDSSLFSEILQEYPLEIEGMFEDFTFYHNMVGGATRTKYAIPYIFTGKTNTENDSYVKYLEKSFNDSPLIKELQSEKYDARLYTESSYVDMTQTKAIDNIVGDVLYPTSGWGLTKDFLRLVAFRYAPHIMKKYFWIYSGEFDVWKENNISYILDDSSFYEKLKTESVKCSIDKNVFRFYHLVGAHAPFTMNDKCERVALGQASEIEQGFGSLRIVSEFIKQLKKTDVYENSTIFVMADHGAKNYEQNPLFMVKLRGIQQQFRQSEVALTYKNLPDMLVSVLKGQEIDIEKDYICTEERYFYVGTEENNKINIIEYATKGNAYDAENFYPTGQIFKGNTEHVSYKYQLGEKLSFTKEATANLYCKSGFYKNEATHTWAGKGGCAEMYFELEGEYDDLLLELIYGTYSPPQNVKIYANNNMVADYMATRQEKKQIFIPKEYVENGVLDLKFEFPDVVSPADLKESGDGRKLALAMLSMCISSTSKNKYELGKKLLPDDILTFATSGFSYSENTHIWTQGEKAVLYFNVTEDFDDLQLDLNYGTYNGVQAVKIYANNVFVAEFEANGVEQKRIIIPHECVKNGKLRLEFQFANAVAPSEVYSNSGDNREIALAFCSLMLSDTIAE